MIYNPGVELICCHVSNLHSINVHCVPLSGVARAVGLILHEEIDNDICTVGVGSRSNPIMMAGC